MVKRLFLLLLFVIVITTPLSIVKISNNKDNINNSFGFIIINKINIKEELFPIDSSENTIELLSGEQGETINNSNWK